MSLLWIQVRGVTLYSRMLCLPLSPSSELMWLGLSDLGSPIVMDADDVIKVYNKKSSLWRVASDMNGQVILYSHYIALRLIQLNDLFKSV